MLSAKNTYILLCTLLVQLGCSSNYLCHMQNPGGSESGPSRENSGGRAGTRSEDEEIKKNIRSIVDNFLGQQSGNVKRGLIISDRVIELAINDIDEGINTVDISSLPKGYIQFLNEYGSVYGRGHAICGPTDVNMTTDKAKAQHIASLQRGFKNNFRFRGRNKNPEEIKCYWLIARIEGPDQCDQYYIDLSDKGKGRIYSIDRSGSSRLFSKDFVGFLTKFFDSFSMHQEDESSSDSD